MAKKTKKMSATREFVDNLIKFGVNFLPPQFKRNIGRWAMKNDIPETKALELTRIIISDMANQFAIKIKLDEHPEYAQKEEETSSSNGAFQQREVRLPLTVNGHIPG